MMMITQEQGFTEISGINVYDAVVVLQMVEKMLQHGIVSGKELGHVAGIRMKFLKSVRDAISVDLDVLQEDNPK